MILHITDTYVYVCVLRVRSALLENQCHWTGAGPTDPLTAMPINDVEKLGQQLGGHRAAPPLAREIHGLIQDRWK